jgi:hypothetical protein
MVWYISLYTFKLIPLGDLYFGQRRFRNSEITDYEDTEAWEEAMHEFAPDVQRGYLFIYFSTTHVHRCKVVNPILFVDGFRAMNTRDVKFEGIYVLFANDKVTIFGVQFY